MTALTHTFSGRAALGAIVCGLLLGLASCVSERSPVTGERQYYGYSWAQEQQLGKQADEQISAQLGVYEDARLQAYVERVAKRVLEKSDFNDPATPEQYRGTEFTFRVLNSPVVNAFALPGGYVYVTRGLLAHLENEAQLAVVLGHEIAHVAARHASRQALRAQLSQVGLLAGAIVGQQVLGQPGVAENILNLGGTGLQLLLTKYGRDAEREADLLGVEYAAREGYQVAEAAGFFRSLERLAEGRSAIPTWQSTHPDPGERANKMRELAREWSGRVALDKTARADYLAQIDGMVVGDNPREGYVDEGAFFHPDLRFHFGVPNEWELLNQRAAVVLLAPERRAVMTLSLADAATPRDAADKLAAAESIQVVRSQPTRRPGSEPHRVAALVATPQGNLALLNYFFRHSDKVYSFLGYTTESQFAAYEHIFVSTIESFGELSDAARLAVEPVRLAVVAAPRSASIGALTEAAAQGSPSHTRFDAKALAVMNQRELDETVPAGTQLKLIAY